MEYQNLPPPPDWGVVKLQSFEQQKKIMDEQSMAPLNVGFAFTNGCGACQKNQPFFYGCRHIVADAPSAEDHEGIVLSPSHQFLCRTCWKNIERKKFNWGSELGLVCRVCCAKLVIELQQRNPELVLDLFHKKR